MTDQVAAQTNTYSYDGRNRLTAATRTGDSRSWAYDTRDNRTSQTINGTVTSYGYNDANQLCWRYTGTSSNACTSPPGGSTTYSYDGLGGLTGRSDGFATTYNPRGQASSITPAGGSAINMTYADVDQTRRLTAGTRTFDNGLLGVAREVDGSTTAWFIRDDTGRLVMRRGGSSTHYYLYDGLGSVVGLASTAGNKANNYTYDPLGCR